MDIEEVANRLIDYDCKIELVSQLPDPHEVRRFQKRVSRKLAEERQKPFTILEPLFEVV